MKKIITAVIASALAFNSLLMMPFSADAAENVYEFEDGNIKDTGDNETVVVPLSGADGGKAVDLKDTGDSVTVSVNAVKSGMQQLDIRYNQPYDENGKYQNIIVNGKDIGQIFCEYTGDSKFSTVSVSTELKEGINTVEIEGSWGWTYLDSLTLITENSKSEKETDSPETLLYSSGANPVISRNVPSYSGKSSDASFGNDDKYYTSWNSSAEDHLAYDLSEVPENQRRKVLAVWYNLSTYDNIGVYVSKDAEPVDYTIDINKADGGKYPETGWETVEKVSGNSYSSRQHYIDMSGYNWIRINVTKNSGNRVRLNFDIHDASNGISDSWIFFGDSITAGGMGNAYGTGFAEYVNQKDSNYFPIQENGGIGGITSTDGKNNIDKWLSTSPAKYVSIAYGTNDAWGNPNNAGKYYDNTKYMIDVILKAGKTPVLPKIPYATNKDVGTNTGYYNAMIDKLYSEYGDKLIHGPDFDEFFRKNEWGLSADGVHPNSEGYDAMRKLWAETMYENVYKNMQVNNDIPDTLPIKGDVNSDGELNVADLLIFQKWLLAVPDTLLENAQSCDLNGDNCLDVFDMIMMRKLILMS